MHANDPLGRLYIWLFHVSTDKKVKRFWKRKDGKCHAVKESGWELCETFKTHSTLYLTVTYREGSFWCVIANNQGLGVGNVYVFEDTAMKLQTLLQ